MAYLDTVAERIRPDFGGSSTTCDLPLRVLLVEDETMVAMLVEDMLEEIGCTTQYVAASVTQALDWLRHRPALDVAVLDANLFGAPIYPVANMLRDRGVPFVFSTGYGEGELHERYPGIRVLQKPYAPEALGAALAECHDGRRAA